jgi:hypothetical protein
MHGSHDFDFLKSVKITPAGFFICLLAAIPALLIAKLFVALATSFAKALLEKAAFEGDFTMPLCYFVIYGLGGYIFLWVGAALTSVFRPFDILFYCVLAAVCGFVLMPAITAFGTLGTCWGALMAMYFSGKSFEAAEQEREQQPTL